MKNIPLSLPCLGTEEKNAVLEVLDSGWLAHGEYNHKFEKIFSEKIGVKHAITMNSATSALETALKAHGIRGEVIIPSFTFVATANAVLTSGAIPVFCDVDISTRNMKAHHIDSKITKNTEAVIIVHFGGQPCQMDDIMNLCKKHHLLLIEDSAETLGATWHGKQAGSFGIGCFSFFPTKNITTGEGGMLTTNDNEIARKVRCLMGHGIDSTTFSREKTEKPWFRSAILPGHNYRMSNILAAIGYHQFLKLEPMNQKRIELVAYMNTRISSQLENVVIPEVSDGATHVYQMYTVMVPEKKRNSIVNQLRNAGIGASVHFDPPVHLQAYYKDKFKCADLPNTEKLANSIITLPMYPDMTISDIDIIVQGLKDCLHD